MKKLIELLLCIVHPLAVVLIWLDLARRTDITDFSKIIWGLLAIIPLVPFVYVLVSGDLWPFSTHNATKLTPAT